MKKLIIGICNGFQTLSKTWTLPTPTFEKQMTLYQNDHNTFIDKWVEMKVNNSLCVWAKDLP